MNELTPAQRRFLEALANNNLPPYNTLGALRRMANKLIRAGWVTEIPLYYGEWTRYELTASGRAKLGQS